MEGGLIAARDDSMMVSGCRCALRCRVQEGAAA